MLTGGYIIIMLQARADIFFMEALHRQVLQFKALEDFLVFGQIMCT